MAYSVSHQSEYKKIVTKQPGYLANMDLVLPFFLPARYLPIVGQDWAFLCQ